MKSPKHHVESCFPVVDGEIQIGGIALSRLAAQVGQTPFYAYERAALAARVSALRDALPERVEIHYAMKANPMPAVVQFLARQVDGLDVASGGELLVALDAGVQPAEISMAGPGKSDRELRQSVAAGICINVESLREVELAARHGEELGITPRVAVRVNPDFELKSSGMKMGGGPKQFGIDAEQVPDALKHISDRGLDLQGLHIYSGSQNLRADAVLDAQSKTLDLAEALGRHTNAGFPVINIGGGFGVPYFPGDHPLDLAAVGDGLAELLDRPGDTVAEARIVVELGRYLVAEAGVYVCRVVDRKLSRGQVFLVTDGGLHHHLAASGNFGQVLRKNYPVTIGNRAGTVDTEIASVVGPLCTPLDLLADRMSLPRAEPDDLVVVFQSGAYGLTASPTAFLGHPAPVEVLV
jgi:diaminopimelate decarboxylase